MIRVSVGVIVAAFIAACASTPAPSATPAVATVVAPDPLGGLALDALPDWTDRYASSTNGDVVYFDISGLMARYGLARHEAVEVQNHYRDQSRADPEGLRGAWFADAIARVKAGEFESGYRAKMLREAPFIVVFDLDATLYDQYLDVEPCGDLEVDRPKKGKKMIQRTPGWEAAFDRIRALGGAIALFSANVDDPTILNLKAWMWRGKPLYKHPEIAAVMTNSYLTRQSKHEGPGADNPRRGHPVVMASKDLRQFDEALERAVIVDDNPTRLVQLGNARLFKKFHGAAICGRDAADPAAVSARASLGVVVDELAAALDYAKAHGVSFIQAYRPYTMVGAPAVDWLARAFDGDRQKAIEHARAHPELIDPTL